MLVLTRKRGESLKIGDEVTVTVLGVRNRQVRLGIDAPAQVPVHREELLEPAGASVTHTSFAARGFIWRPPSTR